LTIENILDIQINFLIPLRFDPSKSARALIMTAI
jgi:hypothetical protein